MLTMAMTARLLTDWFGDGRLLSYGLRFLGLVWPGDTLVATATVDRIDHAPDPTASADPVASLDVVTTTAAGTPVVAGYATARLAP
jgi:acyl dehydratase